MTKSRTAMGSATTSGSAIQMSDPNSDSPSISASADSVEQALERVRDALKGLKYGVISIIVQDGVVVQVEKTEKVRLRRV